ncbi:hydrolase 2, exosortase A system-associated [Chromatium okenii]|uniref:hydrolase 2, exosortase A system-associated n=1 Tax=Chromatium okenii TaxID=61644 RepID=UPI0026F0935A|nr:hydrolase 2, exosortase A system-associated [Chromatium okenii]MBV5308072.1 hydrolase 2, exosortase A system-associated [Chromatium okenii]
MNAAVNINPFFLPTPLGHLFCMYSTPVNAPIRAKVIYLHPFAEEMHKSRRMAALQARQCAAAGIAVLQLDLTGCGDSWGDFGDARWERWKADVFCAIDWLNNETNNNTPLFIWGLRLGGMLAVDCAKQLPNIAGIILWQPIINGELFINQFLRIKLASEMLSEGQARIGTRQLREQLTAGESVEIGGYCLAAELAQTISTLRLEQITPSCPVIWIDVVADANSSPTPAQQKVIQEWENNGCQVQIHRVVGEPFWITQEITECPALLTATMEMMEQLLQ